MHVACEERRGEERQGTKFPFVAVFGNFLDLFIYLFVEGR